jgi:hypothetical protein
MRYAIPLRIAPEHITRGSEGTKIVINIGAFKGALSGEDPVILVAGSYRFWLPCEDSVYVARVCYADKVVLYRDLVQDYILPDRRAAVLAQRARKVAQLVEQ